MWAQCGLVHQKKEPLGGKNEEILRWCSRVHPRWCAGVRIIKPRKARRNGRQTGHLKPVRNADLPTNKNKLLLFREIRSLDWPQRGLPVCSLTTYRFGNGPKLRCDSFIQNSFGDWVDASIQPPQYRAQS